ncbi:alanine/glycine:cation symporter family protein [soil metagenome]
MKSFLAICCAIITVHIAVPVYAQDDSPVPSGSIAPSTEPAQLPDGIDRMLDGLVKTPADIAERVVFFPAGWSAFADYPVLATPWVLYLLVGSGIFFTLYFGFINISGFPVALRTIRGKYSTKDDPGEISHFQALTAAVSGTVGLGNIAGVAIAVSLGGPGATFWMIVCGLIGMSTKFCEVTLGVRYRDVGPDGRIFGGSMYTLRKGFAERGWPMWGKVLAVVFAISCLGGAFGAGCMFQVNQAFTQLVGITGGSSGFWFGKGWIFGLVMAFLTGLVIIGGIKSIARVTGKLVPFMCVFYVLTCLYVIFAHLGDIPAAFATILKSAFTSEAAYGGFFGVLISGVRRAAFSNEAGFGSAPIAHAAVRTRRPASEGYVALLEPFVDTIIICTMTALVIVVTQQRVSADQTSTAAGIAVTSRAFGSVISWFPYMLFVAVVLFAFSTMVSWSYYGQQAAAYIFGRTSAVDLTYKVIFCACVVFGAAATLDNVLRLSDALIFTMCFPNFIALYALLPKVKEEIVRFRDFRRAVDRGETPA